MPRSEKIKDVGITDVFCINRECLPRIPVLFSDGTKGIKAVVNVWGEHVNHDFCERHMSGAALDSLKKQCSIDLDRNNNIYYVRSKVKVPVAILHDSNIFKLCRASTNHECQADISNLYQTNRFSVSLMPRKNITPYSKYAMRKMTPK